MMYAKRLDTHVPHQTTMVQSAVIGPCQMRGFPSGRDPTPMKPSVAQKNILIPARVDQLCRKQLGVFAKGTCDGTGKALGS